MKLNYVLLSSILFTFLAQATPEIMSQEVQAAIYAGSDKDVRNFLRNRDNINARNYYWQTPLILAASNGQVNLISGTLIKDFGANLEDRDRDGNTALISAAQYGWTDLVKYLLSIGANKAAKNNLGETAADAAQNATAKASGGPFTEVINLLK